MVNDIIAYENGELDAEGTLALFGTLLRTGQAWSLQGHYGRTASALVEAGWLTANGERTDRELSTI
jgi:hypothetical protein